MDAPWWILFPLILLAMAIIARMLRVRGNRLDDMIERQRRESDRPPISLRDHGVLDGNILDEPEILREIARGHKIEAIKLVRERFGLGLKEAKDLVDRHS